MWGLKPRPYSSASTVPTCRLVQEYGIAKCMRYQEHTTSKGYLDCMQCMGQASDKKFLTMDAGSVVSVEEQRSDGIIWLGDGSTV